jgi:hypothetical protein
VPRSHALFTRLFDYAGLFPPASLDMADAMARFGRYRTESSAWMLGRLIVPASRLEEVSATASLMLWGRDRSPSGPATGSPSRPSDTTRSWRFSALVTSDPADAAHVAAFNLRHADAANGAAIIDTVETVVATPDDVRALRAWASRGFEVYCELAPGAPPGPMLDAIARAGLHAKLRMGGTHPESVPPCEAVAAFLCACVARGVVAKATAGLHHAITGVYPLSGDARAVHVLQFGYLNLVLAAGIAEGAGRAAVQSREVQATVCRLLALQNPPNWVGHHAVEWSGDHGPIIEGPLDQFAIAGRGVIRSIGTCSFEDPLDDARQIGLMA